MITVEISKHNSIVHFSDNTPEEEIKSVLAKQFPSDKSVLGKSAEILSSIPERAYESIKGIYKPRAGEILSELPSRVGKVGLKVMGLHGEEKSIIPAPELLASHAQAPSLPETIKDKTTIQYEDVLPSHLPSAKPETISSRTEEPPGVLERIFRKPQEMTVVDRARASNILGLSEASGLPTKYIEENYDAITKNIGIRGVPTTGELITELMQWAIKIGLGMKPLKTIVGVASYMGVKEVESVATQAFRGEKAKLGAGRELKEFLGPLREPWSSAAEVAEFALPASFAARSPRVFKEWYYRLTVREKAMVRLTYDDLASRGWKEADLTRMSPRYWQEAFQRRAKGEVVPDPPPDTFAKTPIVGSFNNVISGIKDPKQRMKFVRDVKVESQKTGKGLDEIAVEKIKQTEPVVDIALPEEPLALLREPRVDIEQETLGIKEPPKPPVEPGKGGEIIRPTAEELSKLPEGVGWIEFESEKGIVRGKINDINPYDKTMWVFPADRSLLPDPKNRQVLQVPFDKVTKVIPPKERVEVKADPAPSIEEDFRSGKMPLADIGTYAKDLPPSPVKIELPELVEIYEILKGSYPKVLEELKTKLGKAGGVFDPVSGTIKLVSKIFENPDEAVRVLSHELGHLADWFPDFTNKRGNILGHLGSLKNYLKDLIERFPIEHYPAGTAKAFGVLTEADRNILRKEAKRQATQVGVGVRELSADDILQVWNAVEKANPKLKEYIAGLTREQKVDIAKAALRGNVPDWVTFRYENIPTQDIRVIYQRLIEEEIAKRGLWEKDKIMDELKALSQTWKPFNEALDLGYTKYRHSPEELYADAISVLFNNPELLKQRAPLFNEAFFNYLSRKPKVNTVYREITDRIHRGPEEIAKARDARITKTFKEGEAKWEEAEKPTPWAETTKESLSNWLVDKGSSLYAKTKSPMVRMMFEDWVYRDAKTQEYINEIDHFINEPFSKLGIPREVLEKVYLLNRITKDIKSGKMAEPLGFSTKDAPGQLDYLRKTHGTDKIDEIIRLQQEHWRIRNETIFPLLEKAKILAPKLIEVIKNNPYYATWDIVPYITKRFGSQISARIFERVGTLAPAAPPFTATVLKDMALIRAATYKLAAEATVKALPPEFVEKAKIVHGRVVPPGRKDAAVISFLQEGKLQAFYIPNHIAKAFKRSELETNVVVNALRVLNKPFRDVFVNYNPGFYLFNINRDFHSALRTLPEATLSNYLPYIKKAIPIAFRGTFSYDPLVQRMLKEGSLIPSVDFSGSTESHLMFDRIMKKFKLNHPTPSNPIIGKIEAFADWMNMTGLSIERVPKVAAWNYLRERFPNMPIEEVAFRVRRAGSPPFLVKGHGTSLITNLLLFANPAIQGYRMHWERLREDPKSYAWAQTKYGLIPTTLKWLATVGVFGAGIQEIMKGFSEYNLTNYMVVPLGISSTGKSIGLRLPIDEQSRLITGVYWNLLRTMESKPDAGSTVFDYTQSQFPGISPPIEIGLAIAEYLGGRNPIDKFRRGPMIPEDIYAARGAKGEWRPVTALLKSLANKAGVSIVYKFKNDEIDKIKSELETVLGYPGLSNILGRFIIVEGKGISEEIREVRKEVSREEAKIVLDAKQGLAKIINAKPETVTSQEANAMMLKPELVKDNTLRMIAKRGGATALIYLEEYMRATSEAQKFTVKQKILETLLRKSGKRTTLESVIKGFKEKARQTK